VKIGGGPSNDGNALRGLAAEIALVVPDPPNSPSARQATGASEKSGSRFLVAVVHGGGSDVSSLSRRLGLSPTFSDGIRMTTEAEMDVVDMVLCGLVNKRIVRVLRSAGVNAIGISGADSLLTGNPINDRDGSPSRTAHVSAVDAGIVLRLWEAGYVPVIASPGTDEAGRAVNINADEAALAVGSAVRATAIIFLSDVPGIRGADDTVISTLSVADGEQLIEKGTITGGMVAKLRSSAGAIAAGVNHIVIGGYEKSGDLSGLLSGSIGTTIYGDQK